MAEEKEDFPTKDKIEDEWLIRNCQVYEDEYNDCTSIRARFNQYYTFGDLLDCSQWKRDCDNCYRWVENNDTKSGEGLVASEKARRMNRLLAHYKNNVWERRKEPPQNWNSPLPEHIQKRNENTYLDIKAKEMRGEATTVIDPEKYCVIS